MQNLLVNHKPTNLVFEVDIEGRIFQEIKVTPFLLDEIRLLAANHYLTVPMTKPQKDYWKGVANPTHLSNFSGKGKW